MKTNHLTTQPDLKKKIPQVSNQVQLNQLSAQKIRSLIVQNIFKKSNSMADLGVSSPNDCFVVKTKEGERGALRNDSEVKIEESGDEDWDKKDKNLVNDKIGRDFGKVDFE